MRAGCAQNFTDSGHVLAQSLVHSHALELILESVVYWYDCECHLTLSIIIWLYCACYHSDNSVTRVGIRRPIEPSCEYTTQLSLLTFSGRTKLLSGQLWNLKKLDLFLRRHLVYIFTNWMMVYKFKWVSHGKIMRIAQIYYCLRRNWFVKKINEWEGWPKSSYFQF